MATDGAYRSTLHKFFFAGKNELDPAKLCLSIPHSRLAENNILAFLRNIFVTTSGKITPMSTVFLSFKHQCVPPWPLDAQITGLAHSGACRSSQLPPRLHLENVLPPSLILLCVPMFPSKFLPPEPAWPSWNVLLQLPNYSLP